MTTTHGMILLVVLALAVLLLPTSPYMGSLGWGYLPSIVLAVVAVILTLLILQGPARGRLL